MRTIERVLITQGLAVALILATPVLWAQDRQQDEGGGSKAGDVIKGLLEEALDKAVPGGAPSQPSTIWPGDGREFAAYQGPLPLRWQPVENAGAYEIEIDCEACQSRVGWARNQGEVWRYDAGVSGPPYRLDLSAVPPVGAWRWRVRATRSGDKSAWSPWSHFEFRSATPQDYRDQDYGDPDYSGQAEQGYGDQGYGSPDQDGYGEGYGDQGYGSQDHGGGARETPEYGEQGSGGQGYEQGYENQGYGDQGYSDPGNREQEYGGQDYGSQDPGTQAAGQASIRCSSTPSDFNRRGCIARIKSYFFDRSSRSCREFTWGGCAEPPPFTTVQDCRRQCASQ
ncbi:MAG: BPTI/Kunitz-type proteinase inhibitor domain-containing protein [Gammaproteobacteria bacterium]|nr:BPTI/Kunitz-type proteinase inhibitor domain-containing protein [Gammaproteobacteria bacterium]